MIRKKGISSDSSVPIWHKGLSTGEVLLMRQETPMQETALQKTALQKTPVQKTTVQKTALRKTALQKTTLRKTALQRMHSGKNHASVKRLILLLTAVLLVFSLCFLAPFTMTVRADEPTDEIEHFEITVDVQEDASLQMTYHIDWKVLDDEQYGPLEWVDIGMPNSHHSEITALGDNIDHIEDKGKSLEIYLDRSYYQNETASFEFSFVQDHMYQIDRFVEGETVFAFTPAWFDGMEVKDLTIRWNEDKAGAWQPECNIEDGYLVFSSSLQPGERYSMTVAYPNDASGFAPDR